MRESKGYTSRLVIEMIDEETGERVDPGNTLVDSSDGLTREAALSHHYVLKRAYARALTAYKTDGVDDSAVTAVEK